MSDGDSLKARFAFGVLPGNTQVVGAGGAVHYREPFQLIPTLSGGDSIAPGFMRQDRLLLRQNAFDGLKADMGLRWTRALSLLIFQEHS